VQAGSGWDSEKNAPKDPDNPPRLELEAVGHGAGYRTWSLLYRTFPGKVTSAFEGAWEDMHQWALGGGLAFKRADGLQFPASLILVDSGDGNLIDQVYAFTARWQSTYPSKGFSALKKQKDEKGDEAGPHNFKRYRMVKTDRHGDIALVEISTNFYKTHVYANLKIDRQPTDPQRPGFCNFPRDRGERFFQMLTAEEKRSDGSFHAGGRRNEALDCRVMALCAGDVFLDAKVAGLRAAAKTKGSPDAELLKINHAFVLEILTRQTAMRMVA
jgi:phage terminase large subunit GpA-like protein